MIKISRAAIKWAGLVHNVPAPGRHHDVIREMAKRGFGPECMHNQGFLTDLGHFVSREEALVIAKDAGQIIRRTGQGEQLFSEDVW